eukprot:PhF_6_TR21657/c4_g3_i1/m.30862
MSAQPAPQWKCTTCGTTHTTGIICNKCFTHQPPEKNKFPQIFAGCRFHFNGIVQKSLLSQSFNKEWRMAQAHGADCVAEFDVRSTKQITHLIYRRGYERSDKVRAAVSNTQIFVVPVEWMLDCMMARQRLPEAEIRLITIPVRALPLDPTATTLEHHKHPYYVANQERFPEPSVTEVAQAKQAVKLAQSKSKSMQGAPIMKVPKPPEVTITSLEVWPKLLPGAKFPPLFGGTRMLFSDGCPAEAKQCAVAFGATLQNPEVGLAPGVTHLIYCNEDRKSPIVAQGILGGLAALQIAPLIWVQDSIQARELLPNAGPYTIPQKLLNSVKKK